MKKEVLQDISSILDTMSDDELKMALKFIKAIFNKNKQDTVPKTVIKQPEPSFRSIELPVSSDAWHPLGTGMRD